MKTLDKPYSLTSKQIAFYQENKFIKLKDVFHAETLAHYRTVILKKVKALSTESLPLEERDTYSKAFLQVMNLWRESEDVKEFVFSKNIFNNSKNQYAHYVFNKGFGTLTKDGVFIYDYIGQKPILETGTNTKKLDSLGKAITQNSYQDFLQRK